MIRLLGKVCKSHAATDGEGVKINRNIAGHDLRIFDPFLMLDEIYSKNPQDYMGGFPEHPHRGFETVTYMMAGKMRHRDHLGNEGIIEPGDVQWMTAGRGVLHSEFPLQDEGGLHGFQIWVNLPAKEKMVEAKYREISRKNIPVVCFGRKSFFKLIAGCYKRENDTIFGPIEGVAVDPEIFDVSINGGDSFFIPVSPDKNVLIYVYRSRVKIENLYLSAGELGILNKGDHVRITSETRARFLYLAGTFLNESIANWGPFVMNTPGEIDQAIKDFRDGKFAVRDN